MSPASFAARTKRICGQVGNGHLVSNVFRKLASSVVSRKFAAVAYAKSNLTLPASGVRAFHWLAQMVLMPAHAPTSDSKSQSLAAPLRLLPSLRSIQTLVRQR